jgi:Carboxypeptidase regulatory-like domain
MRGAVTSAAGQAVGAARVTLMRSGKAVSVRSGARGDFLLRNLEAGRYRVLVSKAGYRSAAETVSLEAGANRVHRYQLEKTVTRVSGTSRRTTTSAGATGAARTRSIAGRVVGRVFDAATGKPVRGASIAIQGHEPVTTNAAGVYGILSLRPARYRVVVQTNGFAPADRNVVVSTAKVARLDFGLTRDRSHAIRSAVGGNATTVSLTGRVLDARTRRAIARAVVSAGARRIATDSAGRFTVPDLRPGVHRIFISADGYQMASVEVTVRANDRTNFTFTLIKAAAPARRQ